MKQRQREPRLPHHVGTKRNKVRIPKQSYDLADLPVIDFLSMYRMRSSEKGEGLKVCVQEQRHELVKAECRPDESWFVYCRRCGDLIGLEHDPARPA